jgi:hypothetical protein
METKSRQKFSGGFFALALEVSMLKIWGIKWDKPRICSHSPGAYE